MEKVNKDLLLDDGCSLKWFVKDYNHFLNKTTLIYGRTNSGKSVIIDEIMFLLKDHIPIPFVICESSVTISSSPYVDKLPNNCIKSGATKEWLEQFMSNQKGKAALYKTANDFKIIKKVFDKIKTSEIIETEKSVKDYGEKYIDAINNNSRFDFSQKKEQIVKITNIQKTHLINLYKTTIRKNKFKLETGGDLTPDEICCVNYLDFNPNVLLIYDDCAANFKTWVKESTSIKEMFYNGRHYYITQIITAQDDKEIDSALRKNALISIFTTQQSATANFERKSNSYSKSEIKKAELCIKKIFNDDNKVNFKKLVYLQNGTSSPFCYTIANIYEDFHIGSDMLWQLDKKISNTTKNPNSNNAFFNNHYAS
jgi:hypothetical protein